ncbi:MAG: response regulator transcription factor [Hydrogenovibrio sp.]
MTQLLLFVQDPHALKSWSKATEFTKRVLYTLDVQPGELDTQASLLLIQLPSDAMEQAKVEKLIQMGFEVILFSNTPSATEGVQWFQKGIKGYMNTFAQAERIAQAIETVQTGNIWLGQSVMQSLVQAVSKRATPKSTAWKSRLSEREIEAMEWVLLGKNNQEIAEAMHISERTVKAHMHNLLEKLEAKDRLNLVIKVQNWSA